MSVLIRVKGEWVKLNLRNIDKKKRRVKGLEPYIEVFDRNGSNKFLFQISLLEFSPQILCSVFGKGLFLDEGDLELNSFYIEQVKSKLGIWIDLEKFIAYAGVHSREEDFL